jgi:hypothetical protein
VREPSNSTRFVLPGPVRARDNPVVHNECVSFTRPQVIDRNFGVRDGVDWQSQHSWRQMLELAIGLFLVIVVPSIFGTAESFAVSARNFEYLALVHAPGGVVRLLAFIEG